MGGVRLHPKHGVNPCLDLCFLCGEPRGVALLGAASKRITGQDEAPHGGVAFDPEPCDKCKGYMQQGVIFIGVDEDRTTDPENPYRTGEFLVMSDSWVERNVLSPELRDTVLRSRVCFVQQAVCQGIMDAEAARKEAEDDDRDAEA